MVRQFREIDTQIANTKSNIATQASERQKRQQVEHLSKLEQERQALVQQCINTSQSRRGSSVHHQSAPQYFAFDEQEIEAHERTKKARMDLDPAKLGRLDYQNWEAYAHGTFPTPESHSVAGMASYGSIASAHPPDWVRFHMPGSHDGLSQPNSPTHLLSASLNTMSLQPVAVAAAAAAAAAGYPPMMTSPAGSTASSSAPTGRDSEGMPTGHRHQAIGALNMPGYGHESQFGGQGHFSAGPSGWPAVQAASGPASAGMEAMHALHSRSQQPMQRTASAPDVLRGYSDAQGPYGSRSSMGGHQQYPPYGAAAYDAARYHGYGRGSAPNYPMYDQHHHHHQQHGYIPQHSASFSRDAHFLNTQPWARR